MHVRSFLILAAATSATVQASNQGFLAGIAGWFRPSANKETTVTIKAPNDGRAVTTITTTVGLSPNSNPLNNNAALQPQARGNRPVGVRRPVVDELRRYAQFASEHGGTVISRFGAPIPLRPLSPIEVRLEALRLLAEAEAARNRVTPSYYNKFFFDKKPASGNSGTPLNFNATVTAVSAKGRYFSSNTRPVPNPASSVISLAGIDALYAELENLQSTKPAETTTKNADLDNLKPIKPVETTTKNADLDNIKPTKPVETTADTTKQAENPENTTTATMDIASDVEELKDQSEGIPSQNPSPSPQPTFDPAVDSAAQRELQDILSDYYNDTTSPPADNDGGHENPIGVDAMPPVGEATKLTQAAQQALKAVGADADPTQLHESERQVLNKVAEIDPSAVTFYVKHHIGTIKLRKKMRHTYTKKTITRMAPEIDKFVVRQVTQKQYEKHARDMIKLIDEGATATRNVQANGKVTITGAKRKNENGSKQKQKKHKKVHA